MKPSRINCFMILVTLAVTILIAGCGGMAGLKDVNSGEDTEELIRVGTPPTGLPEDEDGLVSVGTPTGLPEEEGGNELVGQWVKPVRLPDGIADEDILAFLAEEAPNWYGFYKEGHFTSSPYYHIFFDAVDHVIITFYRDSEYTEEEREIQSRVSLSVSEDGHYVINLAEYPLYHIILMRSDDCEFISVAFEMILVPRGLLSSPTSRKYLGVKPAMNPQSINVRRKPQKLDHRTDWMQIQDVPEMGFGRDSRNY